MEWFIQKPLLVPFLVLSAVAVATAQAKADFILIPPIQALILPDLLSYLLVAYSL